MIYVTHAREKSIFSRHQKGEGRRLFIGAAFWFLCLNFWLLRGWGAVPNILRKTSSGLGSVPSLRGSFSFIGESSENQENNKELKSALDILISKTSDEFYENLNYEEHGMPYADENILKAILTEMIKLGITSRQKIGKVLQFFPTTSRMFLEVNRSLVFSIFCGFGGDE